MNLNLIMIPVLNTIDDIKQIYSFFLFQIIRAYGILLQEHRLYQRFGSV